MRGVKAFSTKNTDHTWSPQHNNDHAWSQHNNDHTWSQNTINHAWSHNTQHIDSLRRTVSHRLWRARDTGRDMQACNVPSADLPHQAPGGHPGTTPEGVSATLRAGVQTHLEQYTGCAGQSRFSNSRKLQVQVKSSYLAAKSS